MVINIALPVTILTCLLFELFINLFLLLGWLMLPGKVFEEINHYNRLTEIL